jgi:polyisoprenoid-binding protein YceI
MAGLRTLSLAVLLAAAAPLAAENLVLELDPRETTVSLRFGATLHTVHGSLGKTSGRIEFDPATGAASGEVVVDLTGATTGNDRRDRKMHERILATGRYPQAVFHLERVNLPRPLRQGENDLQLHGTVDFHGASHPVSLSARATLTGNQVRASGWLEVPYVQWGIPDPSFFLLRVAKVVTVEVTAVGRLEGRLIGDGATQSSRPR